MEGAGGGETAGEKKKVHFVNIWFKSKLSPLVIEAFAEVLFTHR